MRQLNEQLRARDVDLSECSAAVWAGRADSDDGPQGIGSGAPCAKDTAARQHASALAPAPSAATAPAAAVTPPAAAEAASVAPPVSAAVETTGWSVTVAPVVKVEQAADPLANLGAPTVDATATPAVVQAVPSHPYRQPLRPEIQHRQPCPSYKRIKKKKRAGSTCRDARRSGRVVTA